MADSSGDVANNEFIQNLFDGGLSALFEDKEICAHFQAGLREAGCPPPFHIIVFTLLKKMALLGWEFGGQALRSRLLGLMARSRRLSDWLDRIANICRNCQDKNRLKGLLLEHLRDEQPDGLQPQIDDATDAGVLAQLYTAKRFDAQDEVLAALAETLQDILIERSGDAIAPYLGWAGGNDTTIADSIRYNSGLYDFEGRERELDLLERFCGDTSMGTRSNRFSWLLLTGQGGEGKTRLALEFTTHRIGGNWHAGRLSLPDLRQFRHNEWLPAQPTMIVIDYPAQGPEPVHALLANLARRSPAFDWPVKVLLLEREAKGQWFEQVFPASGDGASIRASAFSIDGRKLLEGIAIEPLGADAIVSMMESRFRNAGLDVPGPKLLLAAATKVDNRAMQTQHGLVPMPRPLFAAAVAEVMIATLSHGEEDIEGDWVGALDREHILAEIVRRDRDVHWLPCADGDRDLLIRHENLVALATLSGGLKRSDIRTLPGTVARLMPDPSETGNKSVHEDLLRRISDYRAGAIAPLEPDLLGEYFLLDRLARIDEIEGQDCRRQLCAAAFEIGGDEAVGSALRTAIDFSKRAESLDWLLPDAASNRTAVEAAAGLVVDLTGGLGLRAGSAMDWLLSVKGRARDYDELAHVEAMAAVNIGSHAGTARDRKLVEASLVQIDALRAAYPSSAKIALEEAKAAFNVVTDAVEIDEWDWVDEMLARIDRLRVEFPAEPEIALREAKAALNITGAAGKAKDWSRVEAMLTRVDRLRGVFPDNPEIALREAKAVTNIMNCAAIADDWPRVEIMMSRGRQLVTGGFAGEIAGPLLRLWCSFVAGKIERGYPLDDNVIEELVSRTSMAIENDSAETRKEVLGALGLIKYLHLREFRELLQPFADELITFGLDWSQVPDVEFERQQ